MKSGIVYFPGLNGIRAIAAIAVVISHITLNLNEFDLNPHLFGTFLDGNPKGLSLAGYGVSMFFVLSGFLITYLLVVEKENMLIDIKKFYIRRILRIWPLYYLYLSVVIAIILTFGIKANLESSYFYIFFAPNIPFILNRGIPYLAHYWSLGVEEQFYLFWPWIIKKSTRLVRIIITLIGLLIGIKIVLHLFYPETLLETILHVTRFHCMLIGALGAILYKNKHRYFLFFVNNKITQCICWFVVFLVAINKYHFASFIDNEIISIVSLCLIIGQIEIKNRIVNLEVNAFDFLGKISYSIYVIHPLIILLFSKIFFGIKGDGFCKYILVYTSILGATIFVSYISYTYFEGYFLKLKKKFTIIKSSNSKLFL